MAIVLHALRYVQPIPIRIQLSGRIIPRECDNADGTAADSFTSRLLLCPVQFSARQQLYLLRQTEYSAAVRFYCQYRSAERERYCLASSAVDLSTAASENCAVVVEVGRQLYELAQFGRSAVASLWFGFIAKNLAFYAAVL